MGKKQEMPLNDNYGNYENNKIINKIECKQWHACNKQEKIPLSVHACVWTEGGGKEEQFDFYFLRGGPEAFAFPWKFLEPFKMPPYAVVSPRITVF